MSAVARRRLVDALGLGPLWIRRSSDPLPDGPAARPDRDGFDSPSDRATLIAGLAWEPLRDTIAACKACRLSETRTRAVPGGGAEDAGWLVVGGGPSADDDASGDAYAGSPGRLLDAVLASVGRSRERNAYVTHVVKCRPPADRPATPVEIACCRPFLEREAALLEPRLVLAAGDRAVAGLLGDGRTVEALRSNPATLELGGRTIAAVVTEDPVELLAAPEKKARVWADVCLARSVDPAA